MGGGEISVDDHKALEGVNRREGKKIGIFTVHRNSGLREPGA